MAFEFQTNALSSQLRLRTLLLVLENIEKGQERIFLIDSRTFSP